MLNCLSITLSPLFFEDEFHFALCVLDDGGFNFYCIWRDDGIPTECIFA